MLLSEASIVPTPAYYRVWIPQDTTFIVHIWLVELIVIVMNMHFHTQNLPFERVFIHLKRQMAWQDMQLLYEFWCRFGFLNKNDCGTWNYTGTAQRDAGVWPHCRHWIFPLKTTRKLTFARPCCSQWKQLDVSLLLCCIFPYWLWDARGLNTGNDTSVHSNVVGVEFSFHGLQCMEQHC